MMERMNREWMKEYDKTYRRFQKQWDYHYSKVRKFITKSIEDMNQSIAIIGITPTLPEIDKNILSKTKQIFLLDIYQEGLAAASTYLKTHYNYQEVVVNTFDNTLGFIDKVSKVFDEYEKEKITEDQLFSKLKSIKLPDISFSGPQFDVVIHLSIMDYYFMPLFSKYCSNFLHRYDEFYDLMRNLNDKAVVISFQLLKKMISKGKIILSTPVSRIPAGSVCRTSLFWEKSIEEHTEKAGLKILDSSTHYWEEVPKEGGHTHKILNICCTKKK